MKYRVPCCLLFVSLFAAQVGAAQDREFTVGVSGSMLVPTSALSKRFVAAPGGSLFFFVNRGTPQWGAAFEYVKFSKLADNLSVSRPITDTVGGVPQKTFYQIPLPKLAMSLEMFGASVQARYDAVRFGDLLVNIGFGAGIYRWTFKRNEYRDSLRVQTLRGVRTAAVLNVPALQQQDWSGGLNAGIDLVFRIADPVSVTGGARYKIIIGELWPTLALDLESVSTFQMLDLRAGISVDF
ncbi:MAG: hypothetical protein HY961_21485 [Ignavibacteriae bacterium]|nr:hypothetical protein [Ignavibacteriota bacterium]